MTYNTPEIGQIGPSWATDLNGSLDWLNAEKAQRVVDLLKPEYGYVVGGGDNTAAIVAAIADANPGDHLLLPNDQIVTDPVTCTKMLTVGGWGPFSSTLKPRTAITSPLWTWNLPSSPPGGSIRNYYGTRMHHIGFDLTTAPNARGVEFSQYAQWARVSEVFFSGGFRHIVNKAFNNWFSHVWCFDASDCFVWVDGDTGMELSMDNLKLSRNSAGTTRTALDVVCANASGIKGALWMTNVHQSGAGVQAGLIMSAPSNVSLPLFAERCTWDNVEGPGLTFTNVLDINVANSWVNSAAGGPCVRMTAGGRLKFMGNQYFGGGSPTKTYDFVGGSTGMFTSIGNYCPTNTVYWIPTTGKPVGPWYVDDMSVQTTPLQTTNDLAHLRSVTGFRTGPRRFQDQVTFDAPRRVMESANGPAGLAKLASGFKVVNHTGVTANTRVRVWRWQPSGTLGHLFSNPVNNVAGVSFTINSTEGGDTSDVLWEIVEPV